MDPSPPVQRWNSNGSTKTTIPNCRTAPVLSETTRKDKVCIIGSGNWGSAVATIIGYNCLRHSQFFETNVNMWVYEEIITATTPNTADVTTKTTKDGTVHIPSTATTAAPPVQPPQKLTDIINTQHINVKYLPNVILPSNVIAVADLPTACYNATLLIFVLPHQFLSKLIPIIRTSSIHPTNCRGVSLIKGLGT
jgi:glycerol-3-phosphate dehydrogenase (NAD+)